MRRAFATLGLVLLLAANSNSTVTHDFDLCTCRDCCHIDSIDVTYANERIVQFPQTSADGSYTLLDEGVNTTVGEHTFIGTPYDFVFQYVDTSVSTFRHNVRIFAADPNGYLNCNQSHAFFAESGNLTNYVKVPLAQAPVVEGMPTYCMIDADNRVTREQLGGNYDLYFAMTHLVDEGTSFVISKDADNRIDPVENLFLYNYAISRTSVISDVSVGRAGININVLVTDIRSRPDEVDSECDVLRDVMRKAYLSYDTPECRLAFADGFAAPSAPIDGQTVLYRYRISHDDFRACAESRDSEGPNLSYDTELVLPELDFSETCFFFQPGFSSQRIRLTISAEITDSAYEQFSDFSAQIIDLDIERCLPISDYIVPQASIKMKVLTTSVEPVVWNDYDRPTLGGNDLFPSFDSDTANPVASPNCTRIEGDNQTLCYHDFHTRSCEKIAMTSAGTCVFERSSRFLLENLNFREYITEDLFLKHYSGTRDTALDLRTFEPEECAAPAGSGNVINVEEDYPSELSIRNYYDLQFVDWDNETEISFEDPLLFRVGVGIENEITFEDIEVFIKNVVVSLYDPRDDSMITQESFNVADKAELVQTIWSKYYRDPVFCAYHDPSNAGNACQRFNEDPSRRNALNAEDMSQSDDHLDHICQRVEAGEWQDTRNFDHFLFTPKTWFPEVYTLPLVAVQFEVTSVIAECGDDPSERRVLKHQFKTTVRNARNLQASQGEDLLYVSDGITMTFGNFSGATQAPTRMPTYMPTIRGVERSDSLLETHFALIIAIIVVSVLFLFCVCSAIVYSLCLARRPNFGLQRPPTSQFLPIGMGYPGNGNGNGSAFNRGMAFGAPQQQMPLPQQMVGAYGGGQPTGYGNYAPTNSNRSKKQKRDMHRHLNF